MSVQITISLDNMIYDLYENLNILSDDTDTQYLWLAEIITQSRSKWITNDQNKNRTIDPATISIIPCMSLIDVDNAECCEVITGCKVKRTLQKIPNTIKLHHKKLFTSITPIGVTGNLPYTYLERDAARFFGEGPFEKGAIGAFYLNGYLYFVSKELIHFSQLEKVRIEGVFEDPRQLKDLIQCNGQPCWSYTSNYPISRSMWIWMKEDIMRTIIPIKLKTQQDTSADNQDDVTSPQVNEKQ